MKFDIVTQLVQVQPEQSVTGSSVEKSAGKTGNGSLEPDGTRMQGLY